MKSNPVLVALRGDLRITPSEHNIAETIDHGINYFYKAFLFGDTIVSKENTNQTRNDSMSHKHEHSHGAIDPTLFRSKRGIRAVKISLVALLATAAIQIIIVSFTGSVALLADTIHNLGDGLTAIPLWIAFRLDQRQTTKRFTYGYSRLEDLAGLFILLMILISALLAGYESIQGLIEPREIRNLWAVAGAGIIGFLGNEAVAIYRIRVGKEIGSAALVADGYHARTDGLTSLAVLAGAIGVWLDFPLADPIAGMIITVAIVKILWDSSKSIFSRLVDAIDPEVIDEIKHTAEHISGVIEITGIRARWAGHRMLAELNISVDPDITVEEGHDIACEVEGELMRHLDYLTNASVHVDPIDASGDHHHRKRI